MIRPVVFSNGSELGEGGAFDVLLVSLVYESGQFDVVGMVRNKRTTLRGLSLFKHESEDAHVHRALTWAQQATGVPEGEILRCPDFGRELLHDNAEQIAKRAGQRAGVVVAHVNRGRRA